MQFVFFTGVISFISTSNQTGSIYYFFNRDGIEQIEAEGSHQTESEAWAQAL